MFNHFFMLDPLNLNVSQIGLDILPCCFESFRLFVFVIEIFFELKMSCCFFLKDHQMGRASKHEMTNFLTFLHFLAHLNSCYAGRNLRHSDVNDSDFTNLLILGLYNHNHPCSYCTQKWLAFFRRTFIIRNKLRLVKVICPINGINFLNSPVNRGMPSMIGQCTQKSLVNSSSIEMLSQIVFIVLKAPEHIGKGIAVIFEPKLIFVLDIKNWLRGKGQRSRFARINNNIVLIEALGCSFSNRPHSFFEFSQKPLVPARETVMRRIRITFIPFHMDVGICLRRKPSHSFLSSQVFCRKWWLQHLAVVIHNFL